MPEPADDRRNFLRGTLLGNLVREQGNTLADALVESVQQIPSRGPTLMLRTTAMACDFDVILNPSGPADQLEQASLALDLVHGIEQQLSVYRADSEISWFNQSAGGEPVPLSPEVLDLLQRSQCLTEQTEGAFSVLGGAAVRLWRTARERGQLPTAAELAEVIAAAQIGVMTLQPEAGTAQLTHPHAAVDLGAIGKGYAVDQVAEFLLSAGVENFLVHGGKSSVRAHGTHANWDGWPVGLQNPRFPDRPLLTYLLRDEGMGTSGTAVQSFRLEGQRFVHILDPRTARPAEGMLSATVLAAQAEQADALSTAFFVLGVEKARLYCDNDISVGAILFPALPVQTPVEPVLCRVDANRVFTIPG